jgi:hypothetical protein
MKRAISPCRVYSSHLLMDRTLTIHTHIRTQIIYTHTRTRTIHTHTRTPIMNTKNIHVHKNTNNIYAHKNTNNTYAHQNTNNQHEKYTCTQEHEQYIRTQEHEKYTRTQEHEQYICTPEHEHCIHQYADYCTDYADIRCSVCLVIGNTSLTTPTQFCQVIWSPDLSRGSTACLLSDLSAICNGNEASEGGCGFITRINLKRRQFEEY